MGSKSQTQLSPTATTTLVQPNSTLLGLNLQELTDWVLLQGQPAYRGKQLHDWIYHKGAQSLDDISVFSKQWRSTVSHIPIGRSKVHLRSQAPDKTVKYLLQLADNQVVETVGIPTEKRLTVCVSSQVGCAMACDFCATGKGGFSRNLSSGEIVDQVLTVQEDFKRRVSHIVFMGMGEPLLNTDNVLKAIELLNRDVGIGQRCITLSTVGIRSRIRKLAQHELQVTLAVSLHASNQNLRAELIPSANTYSLTDLITECKEYVQVTGRRISFEYVLLAGVNDSPKQATELTQLLRGFQCHVNLIPYNPIAEADYERPTPRAIQAFVTALQQQQIAVSVRYSRGLEANAACGQLRTTTQV